MIAAARRATATTAEIARAEAGRAHGVLARPLVLALVSGAGLTLAFAPFFVFPALLSYAVLAWLGYTAPTPRAALLRGWCFAFAHYVTALYWIGIAFFADAEKFGALAIPAVGSLCAAMALFEGVGMGLLALRRWRRPESYVLALAVMWVAVDALRGWVSAFQWNPPAAAWAGSDAMLQSVALLGTPGLSILTIAAGGSILALFITRNRTRWLMPAVMLALAVAAFVGGWWRLPATVADQPGIRLRIVQPNIPQGVWDNARRLAWFKRHLEESATPAAEPITTLIWPENGVPYSLQGDSGAREMLAPLVPPGGYLLTGGDHYDTTSDPLKVSNSMFALAGGAEVVGRYDKVNLVPYGEYLPVRSVLSRFGLKNLTDGSFDFTPGPGRTTIALPGLPSFSTMICYEAVLPGDAVDHAAARPAWLLNITNDAWFGVSSGPYQHVAQARMRAVEEGLPLVRAANTGISVITDPYGRIVAALPLSVAGVIDHGLPLPLAQAPPGGAWGSVIATVIAALFLASAWFMERRRG